MPFGAKVALSAIVHSRSIAHLLRSGTAAAVTALFVSSGLASSGEALDRSLQRLGEADAKTASPAAFLNAWNGVVVGLRDDKIEKSVAAAVRARPDLVTKIVEASLAVLVGPAKPPLTDRQLQAISAVVRGAAAAHPDSAAAVVIAAITAQPAAREQIAAAALAAAPGREQAITMAAADFSLARLAVTVADPEPVWVNVGGAGGGSMNPANVSNLGDREERQVRSPERPPNANPPNNPPPNRPPRGNRPPHNRPPNVP